ncbi:hypothetical protein ACR3K2_13670 [Cryptosporidium serpentis]
MHNLSIKMWGVMLLFQFFHLLDHNLRTRNAISLKKSNISIFEEGSTQSFDKYDSTEQMGETTADDWKMVSSEDNPYIIYVYSAYLDLRGPPEEESYGVRINSLIHYESSLKIARIIECDIFSEKKYIDGIPHIVIHKEHHNKLFASSTIWCKPKLKYNTSNEILRSITHVKIRMGSSLSSNSFKTSELVLVVHSLEMKGLFLFEASICIRPWWGEPTKTIYNGSESKEFDDITLLIEFFEAYRLLGIGRITMYNNYLPLGSAVSKIIHYYSNIAGFIEVVPYTLPLIPYKEVWDYAQISMIQDCLLRHTGKSKYVLFIDTDEYLLPTVPGIRLPSLFNMILERKKFVGAIWVPMYLHFLEWPDDPKGIKIYPPLKVITKELYLPFNKIFFFNLKSLQKTCRLAFAGTQKNKKSRRKIVVRPEAIMYMGIHEPEKMLSNYSMIQMPIVDIRNNSCIHSCRITASLHHYRKAMGVVSNNPKNKEFQMLFNSNKCLFNENPKVSDGTIVDKIAWDILGAKLYKSVIKVIQDIDYFESEKIL